MTKSKFLSIASVILAAMSLAACVDDTNAPSMALSPNATHWRTKAILKNKGGCSTALHVFGFSLAGDTLLIDCDIGTRNEKAKVENGEVDHSFFSPTGNYIRVWGNVRTKQMYVGNMALGCIYDLVQTKG